MKISYLFLLPFISELFTRNFDKRTKSSTNPSPGSMLDVVKCQVDLHPQKTLIALIPFTCLKGW